MATELLAVGTNVTPSSDLTVADGETVTVCLKGSVANERVPNASVDIYLKDDDAVYWWVDTLTRSRPSLAIVAPGTFRFQRRAGSVAVGVFSA